MNKLVVLRLDGNLSQGIHVTLEISNDDGLRRPLSTKTGYLPGARNVSEAHATWQAMYRDWSGLLSRITPEKYIYEGSINEVRSECKNSAEMCKNSGEILRSQFNDWLTSSTLSGIREEWRGGLNPSDSIRVLIRTSDESLRKLPWHLWDLVEYYPKAEVGLSTMDFRERIYCKKGTSKKRVKILAILGDSTGIDVDNDKHLLKHLANADTLFLPEPRRSEIDSYLWSQPWDILFFAGHSRSEDDTGRIYINKTESLTIEELKFGLKAAVSNGLELAILNSCDGLGLARALGDLQIPQVIVMREPVPDAVAQDFLKHFLATFSNGRSLYDSVREARERLHRLEGEYPCATWLPVIYQHPGCEPTTWQQLRGQTQAQQKSILRGGEGQPHRGTLFGGRWFQSILILSAITTGLVMGIRYLGMMEPWELQAEDQLMRSRKDEPLDPRILAITVTEEDLKLPQETPENRKGSLSDLALDLVLQKIYQFENDGVNNIKPRVVGLDIYHDFPPLSKSAETNANLLAQMKRNNFLAVCKLSDAEANHPGVEPPPGVEKKRQGFSDMLKDPDKIVRRHLISMRVEEGASPCVAPYGFSALVAFYFLGMQNILLHYNTSGEMQLRDVKIPPLPTHVGAYQKTELGAYQILLNYRSSHNSPTKAIRQFTLKQFLNKDFKLQPEDVKDKIILIGTTAQSYHDYFNTPYLNREGVNEEIPGVIVQGQMVSQVLSAVLDHRPLLWFLPWWEEIFWVYGWSLAGGLLAWRLRSPLFLVIIIVVAGGGLYSACFLALSTSGCWLPIVPPAITLVATSGIVLGCRLQNP